MPRLTLGGASIFFSSAERSVLVTLWLAAVTAFLLYIVLNARRAQRRWALAGPHCRRALDDMPEVYEDLVLKEPGFGEISCPLCGGVIARGAA